MKPLYVGLALGAFYIGSCVSPSESRQRPPVEHWRLQNDVGYTFDPSLVDDLFESARILYVRGRPQEDISPETIVMLKISDLVSALDKADTDGNKNVTKEEMNGLLRLLMEGHVVRR